MYIGHWSKYNISVVIWSILSYETVLTQGSFEGGVVKNTLNVIHATSRGCIVIGRCGDLGMFQAIIYISTQTRYFQPF